MKLIAATIATAITLIPHAALADWVYLGHSRSNDQIFVDDDSIVKEGSIVAFRSKMTGGNTREIVTYAADCQSGLYQMQEHIVNEHCITPPSGQEFPVMQTQLGAWVLLLFSMRVEVGRSTSLQLQDLPLNGAEV